MVLFVLAPLFNRPDSCSWPAAARRTSPCAIDDLPLDLYSQDSPGNGCTQDCGGSFDIKTAIAAHWSTGSITRGKENCPNTATPEIPIGSRVWLGRAWRNGLWASSVVIEWWAYRWNSNPGSMFLIQATWLGVTRSKNNVPVAGINAQRCAVGITLLCRCTCFDDGTFTFE